MRYEAWKQTPFSCQGTTFLQPTQGDPSQLGLETRDVTAVGYPMVLVARIESVCRRTAAAEAMGELGPGGIFGRVRKSRGWIPFRYSRTNIATRVFAGKEKRGGGRKKRERDREGSGRCTRIVLYRLSTRHCCCFSSFWMGRGGGYLRICRMCRVVGVVGGGGGGGVVSNEEVRSNEEKELPSAVPYNLPLFEASSCPTSTTQFIDWIENVVHTASCRTDRAGSSSFRRRSRCICVSSTMLFSITPARTAYCKASGVLSSHVTDTVLSVEPTCRQRESRLQPFCLPSFSRRAFLFFSRVASRRLLVSVLNVIATAAVVA